MRIGKFIEDSMVYKPLLHLAHTTDLKAFREILENPVIKTTGCKVYNDDFSYFFYGRPAYRCHPDVKPNSVSAFYLVSLFLDIDTSEEPDGIMPFDSGAMAAGLYSEVMHPKMKLTDFAMSPYRNSAGKLVSKIFGSNRSYFDGKPKPTLEHSPLEMEVDSYMALLRTRGETMYDDRRGCIEFKYRKDIVLNSDILKAIIMPRSLLRDPKVTEFIETMQADVMTYTCHHAKPLEDARAIVDKAEAYFSDLGLLE